MGGVYFWNNKRENLNNEIPENNVYNDVFRLKMMNTFLWENPIWLTSSLPGKFGVRSLTWEILATLFIHH